MSEKQFLLKFIKHLEHDGYIEYKKHYIADYTDKFLTLHHDNYYEVEFILKEVVSDDDGYTFPERANEATSAE